MAEYTYEDIIMDPNDPRLEGAIGKECYFNVYGYVIAWAELPEPYKEES